MCIRDRNEPLAHGLAALEADASRPVGALTAPVAGRPARLRLELRQANILLASNEYDLALVDLPAPSLSLIHISEPTRLLRISYAVFCL